MGLGWQQILIVGILAILLFGGRGKISSIMGDFAKGIKSFRKGLKEEDDAEAAATARVTEKGGEEAVDVTPPKMADTSKATNE